VIGGVALSSCDGDTLKTSYQIRGSSAGASETKEEKKWVITNGIEMLKC